MSRWSPDELAAAQAWVQALIGDRLTGEPRQLWELSEAHAELLAMVKDGRLVVIRDPAGGQERWYRPGVDVIPATGRPVAVLELAAMALENLARDLRTVLAEWQVEDDAP